MCKLLTGNGEIDITQKASIPVIDSNNLNREALHTKLRKRFHLEPLKQLIEQGYISDCVIIEIRQAIERLEADRTASRKKEDNQPKLTAFYISSTCSNSKKLDSDTDRESTSTLSINNDSDSDPPIFHPKKIEGPPIFPPSPPPSSSNLNYDWSLNTLTLSLMTSTRHRFLALINLRRRGVVSVKDNSPSTS